MPGDSGEGEKLSETDVQMLQSILVHISRWFHYFFPLICNAHICKHSERQYFPLLYPSLKTTTSFRTAMGPNPGAPWPPLMHVEVHRLVHCWISLPFGPCRYELSLGDFSLLESSAASKPWGTVWKYCSLASTPDSILIPSMLWADRDKDDACRMHTYSSGREHSEECAETRTKATAATIIALDDFSPIYPCTLYLLVPARSRLRVCMAFWRNSILYASPAGDFPVIPFIYTYVSMPNEWYIRGHSW